MLTQALEPATAEAAADLLRRAHDDRLTIRVTGGGTKLAWTGLPKADDVLLSTKLLNTPIDHRAGDLTATLPAGATLAEVNDVLSRGRQWLPLDPPFAGKATIGGIVATNDSGPRRHRYGSPRDLIIGIEVALVDGRRVKAGGHVVKNVAGYDLSRLMCGSCGSLALITSATFKLSPLAPASRTLVASLRDLTSMRNLLRALGEAPITPSACEVAGPPVTLLIRIESTEQAAQEQLSAASAIAERHGARVDVVSGDAEGDVWRTAEAAVWAERGTTVRIGVLPSDVASTLQFIDHLAASHRVDFRVAGRAGLGVLFVRFSEPTDHHPALVSELRREAAGRRGYVAVLATAVPMNDADRWGEPGDAAPLMRAVKARFDPEDVLAGGYL